MLGICFFVMIAVCGADAYFTVRAIRKMNEARDRYQKMGSILRGKQAEFDRARISKRH